MLLNKQVIWADSSETVKINDDFSISVNGVLRRWVGIKLSLYLPYGLQFWTPDNLAVMDAQLSYLESIGIRFVCIDLWYQIDQVDEVDHWRSILDLIYQHKMFCVTELAMQEIAGIDFDQLVMDPEGYRWYRTDGTGEDSLANTLNRFTGVLNEYPNIVAINYDNELDYKKVAYSYTAADLGPYLDYAIGQLRTAGVPITHNLMCDAMVREPAIKEVCLNKFDIPCYDLYEISPASTDESTRLTFNTLAFTGNWWAGEFNYGGAYNGWTYDASKLTADLIEYLYNKGSMLTLLFSGYNSGEPGCSLFTSTGAPIPAMVAIAAELDDIQSPIIHTASFPGWLVACGIIGLLLMKIRNWR